MSSIENELRYNDIVNVVELLSTRTDVGSYELLCALINTMEEVTALRDKISELEDRLSSLRITSS